MRFPVTTWLAHALAVSIILFAQVAPAAGFKAERIKTSETTFSRPHDLVLSPDRRFLYVTDMGNDVVKVLDPRSLAILGTIGDGELNSPHDAVFDGDGRLLVADTGNDRVAVFTVQGASGAFVHALRNRLSGPEGIDIDANGLVYVTNAAGDNLVVYDGGAVVDRIGTGGNGKNQYDRPHDVEIFGGRIYIADPGNDRIQVMNKQFRFLTALGGTTYDFKEPKYLAIDVAGCLLVADQHHDIIKVFSGNHKLLGTFGSGRRGDGADDLDRPEGVETWQDLIWVSDTYNDRIVLYRRTEGPGVAGGIPKPC